ncbi:MAG: META domain-containing protein [Silicimonas sp.]|jgi:heat shock protein HslJ|nr:META domain-containing protein [Silicimonas sp.]
MTKASPRVFRAVFLLPFLSIGCADETISGYANPDATYRLTELSGTPFEALATISFPEEGRAAGQAPCNAWSAEQAVPYPWISLGPIAATRRACPELAKEQAFFEALGRVTLAEVQGGVLILSDDHGVVMVFEAE